MRCGLSIERFLFVNLDNCQGCGLYTGCGLYSQKYGNPFSKVKNITAKINTINKICILNIYLKNSKALLNYSIIKIINKLHYN
jgi:hypothetical protein